MCKSLIARFGRSILDNRHSAKQRGPAHPTWPALLVLICWAFAASPAFAKVEYVLTDDLWPMENPFTSGIEGLFDQGNQFNLNLVGLDGLPTAALQSDPRTMYGEALPSAPDPKFEPPFFEGRLDIIVGRTGSGNLTLNSGSQLRHEDLIIGESYGSFGHMQIIGESSLYNNAYLILPALVDIGNPYGITWGESARMQDDDKGFDLYVGQGGTGILDILEGGRAEIQDAVSIGDLGGSEGTLLVDGSGSLLRNGGAMQSAAPTGNEIHQFVVGRLGLGTATISNGGTINSYAPLTTSQQDLVGAVIGSSPHDTTQVPDAGGIGYVYVDGSGSSWNIGGDLQVGGFHANHDLMTGDPEGDEVIYPNDVGKGTLTVSNGGTVNIIPPADPMVGNNPNELSMFVGKRGLVDLQGGRIVMQGGYDPGNINNPTPFIDNVQIISDGTIQGDGSIETGIFNNRYEGIVSVSAGQKLEIESTTTFLPPQHRLPLANWGVMEVLGTPTERAELEFKRVPGIDTDVLNAFQNLDVPAPPTGGRTQGHIIAQDATLRFRSGLVNQGLISFSGGTNVVTGKVINDAPSMAGDPGGVIFVSGDNTTVLFENEVINNGVLDLAPNISLVTLLEGLTMGGSGALSTSVGGRPTGQEIGNLFVAGDIALDGLLDVSLFTAPGVPGFSPQPGDTFQILSSASEMTGDFAFVNLPFVSPTVGLFAFPDYSLDAYFITTYGVNLANGADLNGDGIVDGTDLLIVRQNLGNPGGLGDINHDGIVNGTDLFIWQMQVGGPGIPIPGSGAGAGAGSAGTVPEPTSLALLWSGGLLALVAAQRRRRTR